MFTRILVAVDESAPAPVAVELGAELAAKFGAQLALINVTHPPVPLATIDLPMYDIEPPAERIRRATELLGKIRMFVPAGINVEELVAEGIPAVKIVDAARDWSADLIIVGTHGRHGVSRLILGSTAEAVARKAGCPVLVARETKGSSRSNTDRCEIVEADLQG